MSVIKQRKVLGYTIPELNLGDDFDELTASHFIDEIQKIYAKIESSRKDISDTNRKAALTALEMMKELDRIQNLQKHISDKYEKKIKDLVKMLDDAQSVR